MQQSYQISISHYNYSAVIGVSGPLISTVSSKQATAGDLYESHDKCVQHNVSDTQGIFSGI